MVRRVGFGDAAPPPGNRRSVLRGDDDPSAAAPGSGTVGPVAVEAGGPSPKRAGAAARLFGVLALVAWIGLWSTAIWHAFAAMSDVWDTASGAYDVATIAFLGAWLLGALIGWAFGVVILVVLLFGKPITEERRREKEARRAAKRRARAGGGG